MEIRNTLKPAGPGNNIFLKSNVEIKDNEIIMRVSHDSPFSNSGWSCSEISWPAKEGVYKLDLECPIFLPKGIICGVFFYEDDEHEVDIEFGRWNLWFMLNCQFANQKPLEVRKFWNFKRNNKIRATYTKNNITLELNGRKYSRDIQIKNASFIINLWIYGQPAEAQVKIKNFRHTKV